jgi:hypothetical protein
LLLIEATVADPAKTVEEHSSGERIAGFTLIQSGVHSSTPFNALQQVQDEQCALDAAEWLLRSFLVSGFTEAVPSGAI